MSISLLRQLLMKEAVKKSAGSSGIMSINKNIAADVDKLLQKYINDAMQQGVDIETLSPDQLKMIVAMNKPKITPTLNKDVNIYSKQYIDNLDKEIVDSGLYTKKEWANLSDDLKEARRRNFDSNYDDAMEGMVENNVIPLPMKRSFKEEIDTMRKSGDIVDVDDINISEKITDRDMFNNSFLNKPTIEGQMEKITGASNKIKQIQKEQAEMYRPKTDAEIKAKFDKQNKESIQRFKDKMKKDEPEDKADGGRIGFRAGKFVLDKIVAKLLGDPKKVKQAVDDIFPTGDYKYDAQMAADALVENNPRIFKNKLYDDLDMDTQIEIYGAVLEPIQKNMSIARQLKKASRPEKTLAAMKEGKGIDMSDPNIADEFTRFMKETDPQGSKTIEQTVELANFDPKKVKGNAEGGRIGYYTGGITDVEPDLSDIGHGSDSLMARTRLVSPDGQATTSTGLNYLLAEDNDNIRVPFAAGGGGRRAFLKLLASIGGLTAAAKSGILGLGEGGAKKAVTETVKQSAGSGTPPPYFFKLVEKIKTMGDDITEKAAVKDREVVKKYKDFQLTEDVATGEQTIQRMKVLDDGSESYYGKPLTEETYMNYKPGKGQVDETMKGKTPPDEYEQGTAYIRSDREYAGEVVDESFEISDDVLKEVGETITKKADGGRIGFSAGGGKFLLSKLGINSTTTRFLEKVFGKQQYKNLIKNDPGMHRGLLEVAEMFRSKDKEGLKMYMQKFLPHMDDEMVEDFIVGGEGTEGIAGQLIRLGSGRDYAGKLEIMQKLNNVKKLENLDVTDEMIRKPNSDGGRIGFSGGGIFRAIIAKSAAKKGMKPYEFIKATNYKGLPPEVRMYISADEFAKLKSGQQELYQNFIDMAKTRKEFQKNIEGGKNTPARELFESMEKTMDEQSFVPKTVTDKDIGEMELMIKNRFNKGRKDNAEGGLQTMLGE